MPARERPIDRGSRLGRQAVVRLGSEIRLARVGAGLSVDATALAAGISNAEVSRIERGLSPRVAAITLARLGAVVGLEVSIKAFPGGDPLRDAGQHALIATFGRALHASLRWAVEVPLPVTGDLRAWDGLVAGAGWRYGVEAEMRPTDEQALLRRLRLKERDGQVDGIVLVLPETRAARAFLRAASAELRVTFPVAGPTALRRLGEGLDPGGSAVVVLRRPVVSRPGVATVFPCSSWSVLYFREMMTGPYPSPILAPVLMIQYRSETYEKACAEIAVTSNSPFIARSFND